MAVAFLLLLLACQLGGLILYLAARDLMRGLRHSAARKEHRHD